METIREFSKETQSFLAELSENNNKDWFQANKSRYEAGVFEPAVMIFPKEVLEQYRSAVDDSETGAALEKILRSLETEGLPLMEEPEYKRVPRGFDSDHPRGNLLRMKGLGTGRPISWKEAASEQLSDICFAAAEKMKPLMEWIVPLNGRQPHCHSIRN
ncbi:MAG: DUF2461 family protein [Spirochaetia bacterium]